MRRSCEKVPQRKEFMEKEQKQRMTEKERMLAGKLYCPFKVGDNSWEQSRACPAASCCRSRSGD